MSEWEIYLITRLDGVKNFLLLLALLSGMGALVLWGLALENSENFYKRFIGKTRCFAAICIASLLACVSTPTTKEFIAIKGLPPLINEAKDLAPELKKLLSQIFEKGK